MSVIKAQNTTTLASVKVIYDAADEANTLLNGMQTAATAAGTTLNGIYADAETAKTNAAAAQTSADAAQTSADNAAASARNALLGLSAVEGVIDVINWVIKPENVTTDTTADPNKTYYVYDSETGSLSIAEPQSGDNPSALGWYEIDEAIANYISNHVALTDEGLSLVSDNNSTRALITNGYYVKTQDQSIDTSKTYYELVNGEYTVVQNPVVADIGSYYEQLRKGGVYIINNSKDVAYYGEATQIGDSQSFNLKITSTELGFYQADRRVAYLNNNTLYITQSVVVNEMQVGELNNRPEWTWKYDKSDRSLYLKWIGA